MYLNLETNVNRTIVVGDIHGCMDELEEMLERVGFCSDDLLVTVGDMVDRGPESWGVARFFRETPNAYSCMGNHERRVAGTVRGTSLPAWTQKQTLSLLPRDQWDDWAAWFAGLPLVIETPHAIVTHARLDPCRSLDDQEERFTCAVGGPTVTIDKDAEGVPLWYRAGLFAKPVCMGHVGYDNVELVPNGLYALDTGAAKGRRLTAVVLPHRAVVTVTARANHYERAVQSWKRVKDSHVPERILTLTEVDEERKAEELSIFEAAKVLRSGRSGAAHAALVESIETLLGPFGLEETSMTIREQMAARFGFAPTEREARKAFFSAVTCQFNDKVTGRVAMQLLHGETLSLSHLAQLAPGSPLPEAGVVVARLLDEVRSACR